LGAAEERNHLGNQRWRVLAEELDVPRAEIVAQRIAQDPRGWVAAGRAALPIVGKQVVQIVRGNLEGSMRQQLL
jgi:hypothetical protein